MSFSLQIANKSPSVIVIQPLALVVNHSRFVCLRGATQICKRVHVKRTPLEWFDLNERSSDGNPAVCVGCEEVVEKFCILALTSTVPEIARRGFVARILEPFRLGQAQHSNSDHVICVRCHGALCRLVLVHGHCTTLLVSAHTDYMERQDKELQNCRLE